MSKKPMNWDYAYHVATEIKETYILPHCHQATIAGSIRRRKETVGDIEIVCRPIGDELNIALRQLRSDGIIEPLIKNGKPYVWIDRNQPRQVKFTWQGVPFDVYMVLEDRTDWWGYQLVLRTGPADANKLIMHPDFKPTGIKFEDGMVYEMGNPVPVPEEETLFELLNMKFVSPRHRSADIYWRARYDYHQEQRQKQLEPKP